MMTRRRDDLSFVPFRRQESLPPPSSPMSSSSLASCSLPIPPSAGCNNPRYKDPALPLSFLPSSSSLSLPMIRLLLGEAGLEVAEEVVEEDEGKLEGVGEGGMGAVALEMRQSFAPSFPPSLPPSIRPVASADPASWERGKKGREDAMKRVEGGEEEEEKEEEVVYEEE